VVTPGYVQDRHIIAPLLAIARERFPSLKSAIADGGYQGKLTADDCQKSRLWRGRARKDSLSLPASTSTNIPQNVG